jgi:hypothetical protein
MRATNESNSLYIDEDGSRCVGKSCAVAARGFAGDHRLEKEWVSGWAINPNTVAK